MKTWVKVLIVTLVVAIPAFLLGPVLFPPAAGGPEPTAGQMVSFIVLAVLTSLTLGLGVAFLIFGFPVVRESAGGPKLRAWALYVSIGWLLVSWWPHGGLHASIGDNIQQLLYIEHGFHLTSYIAGLVLAYCFFSLLISQRTGR